MIPGIQGSIIKEVLVKVMNVNGEKATLFPVCAVMAVKPTKIYISFHY